MSIAVGIIMALYMLVQQTQIEHLKVEATYCNTTFENFNSQDQYLDLP